MVSAITQQLPEEALPAWDGRKAQEGDVLNRQQRKRRRADKKLRYKKRAASKVRQDRCFS